MVTTNNNHFYPTISHSWFPAAQGHLHPAAPAPHQVALHCAQELGGGEEHHPRGARCGETMGIWIGFHGILLGFHGGWSDFIGFCGILIGIHGI